MDSSSIGRNSTRVPSLPRFTANNSFSQIPGLDTDFEDGTNVAEALKVVDDLYEKEIRNKNKKKLFLKKMFSFRTRSGSGPENNTLQTPKTPTKENKYMFDPCGTSIGAASNITDETALMNTPDITPRSIRDKPCPPGISRLPPTRSSPSTTSPFKHNTERDNKTSHLYYNISPGRSLSESAASPQQSDAVAREEWRKSGRRERTLQNRNNRKSESGGVDERDNCQMPNQSQNTNNKTNNQLSNASRRREFIDFPPIGGVEGMVAPRPILHQVCNGFRKADIPDIVIVYSGHCETSEQWCQYLKKILSIRSEKDSLVELQPVEDLSIGMAHRKDNRLCEERIYHAKFQVFIISPAFLDWVERWNLDIGRLGRPAKLVGLMLGVIDVDLKPIHLQYISNYVEWKVLDLKNEGENEEVTLQVSKLATEILQKEKTRTHGCESSFRIFPRKLNTTQNKLIIILENPILSSQEFEVDMTYEGLHLIIEDYKILKPDCLQIEIPESAMTTSCMASIQLFLDRKSMGEVKLKLESNFSLFQSIWNNQTQPHKMMSESYGMKFRSPAEVDFYLAKTVATRMAAQYSSLETLKPSNGSQETVTGIPAGNLLETSPSLLHWAAHHGFRELASTLLSLGWSEHLNKLDSDHMLPHEIAERAGHTSLATLLRCYRSRFNSIENDNEQIFNDNLLANENTSDKTGIDGYLIPNKMTEIKTQENNNNNVEVASHKNNKNELQLLPRDVASLVSKLGGGVGQHSFGGVGLQSLILTRRVDNNGNIQLAATSQEYMGNSDIIAWQEAHPGNNNRISQLDLVRQENDSMYDIPRPLAVKSFSVGPLYYNNINPLQDQDITTPTSDPFYVIPPAPRPYSNPPPTPHDLDTPTSTTDDDDKQTRDGFNFDNKEDNVLTSSEGDEFERQLELKLMASTDDLDLQEADTRPASPCPLGDATEPNLEENLNWYPPLPVLKSRVSSPSNYLSPLSSQNTAPQPSTGQIIKVPSSFHEAQQLVKTPCKKESCNLKLLDNPAAARFESPVFKSPLVTPRYRHSSNQDRTNTPKIVPESFRRSSTPVLRSSRSESSGPTDERQRKAAYIKMSGRKASCAQQTRIPPPPLGAFPIPKSGSFGSQEKSCRDFYQNVDLIKELKKEVAEDMKKKPESRKDIIAKLKDESNTLGALPSIPSEGLLNQDCNNDDKEICGYLNLTPSRATQEGGMSNNFFLVSLNDLTEHLDDGRIIENKDSTDEENTNTSGTGPVLDQLKPPDTRTRQDSGDQEKGKMKRLLGRLSPANFARRSSRQKKSHDLENSPDSRFQPIENSTSISKSSDNSAMVKNNTSPEPVKTPKLEPKVGKSSLTPVHFDDMNTPQLEPKVSINKLPIGQGGLNIRRRTASPGRQINKAAAPTPPPKLVKATTLPVSEQLTDYDIPRSLTNSRENLHKSSIKSFLPNSFGDTADYNKGLQDARFNSLSRKTSRTPADSVIPESGSPGMTAGSGSNTLPGRRSTIGSSAAGMPGRRSLPPTGRSYTVPVDMKPQKKEGRMSHQEKTSQ